MHADPASPHGHPGPVDDHDRGLAFDLRTLNRRRAITLLGGAGLVATVAACSAGSTTATTAASSASGAAAGGATTSTTGAAAGGASTTATAGTSGATGSCTTIPQETAGPYPGDGSNGKNVLNQSGVVRRDLTSSFGSSSGVAAGVPLTTTLRVLSTANGCAPLVGAAVYVWHCNQAGQYSMYSSGVTDQNYLRGVQPTDANGEVHFDSIFPAAYDGRWPHIHFEVYPSVSDATSASRKLRTSQLALPVEACREVYATSGYEASVGNLARTSLARDMVFSDGYSLQLASVTGSAPSGMQASLTVPV